MSPKRKTMDSDSDESYGSFDSFDYDDETERLVIVTNKRYMNLSDILHNQDSYINNGETSGNTEESSTVFEYKFPEMCIRLVLESYESDAASDYPCDYPNLFNVTSEVEVHSYMTQVRLRGDYPYTQEHPLLIKIGLNSQGRFNSCQRDSALLLIGELRELFLEILPHAIE